MKVAALADIICNIIIIAWYIWLSWSLSPGGHSLQHLGQTWKKPWVCLLPPPLLRYHSGFLQKTNKKKQTNNDIKRRNTNAKFKFIPVRPLGWKKSVEMLSHPSHSTVLEPPLTFASGCALHLEFPWEKTRPKSPVMQLAYFVWGMQRKFGDNKMRRCQKCQVSSKACSARLPWGVDNWQLTSWPEEARKCLDYFVQKRSDLRNGERHLLGHGDTNLQITDTDNANANTCHHVKAVFQDENENHFLTTRKEQHSPNLQSALDVSIPCVLQCVIQGIFIYNLNLGEFLRCVM